MTYSMICLYSDFLHWKESSMRAMAFVLFIAVVPAPRTVPDTVSAKSLQSCPTLCDPMDWSSQAPLSVGFSRQEYWSGFPCLSPGDPPNPGIKPALLLSLALAVGFFTTLPPWRPT